MKKGEIFFSVLAVPVDFIMLISAGFAVYFIRTGILASVRPVLFQLNLPFERYIILVALASLLFLAIYALSGLYQLRSTRSFVEEFIRVFISSAAALMVVIFLFFVRQALFDSRFLVIGYWFFAVIFVTTGRFLMRHLQKFVMRRYGFGLHRLILIGDDEVTERISVEINRNPVAGYTIIGRFAEPKLEQLVQQFGQDAFDEIILAKPDFPKETVVELVDFCHEQHRVFRFVPNMYQTLTENTEMSAFAGVPLIELRRTALDDWGRIFKRATDIFGSLVGLIMLLPSFAIISFCIKWETRGPVFVRLKRVSGKRDFWLYKFRSMIENAEALKIYLVDLNERGDSPLFKLHHDPRVTRVGRILRRYRLDELPQLWNVLRGDISLVGPRPHQPDEIERYQKHHRRVLAIKAGVTGMAQSSGSSDLPFDQEVALDTFYIEHWTLWQDFKLIILTILKLFRDRSAV